MSENHADPVVRLERANGPFTRAEIIPSRGMMLLRLAARTPTEVDVITSPPDDEALTTLGGGGAFPGNPSFSMGGALLAPFANRVRGEPVGYEEVVELDVLGRRVRLPANWSGSAKGAERYAMHGLILDVAAEDVERETTLTADRVSGTIHAGDFGVGWPSSTDLHFEHVLRDDAYTVRVTAVNVGSEPTLIGIGWHPYFNVPSGERSQARLHVPAAKRTLVSDYDAVLPTGAVEPVAGTRYDFNARDGVPLGDLYLDDCFIDLAREADGAVRSRIVDPAWHYAVDIVARSPHVNAVQVYSPPDRTIVALEPQFNLADPFGGEWPREIDTGMVRLDPGASVRYEVAIELVLGPAEWAPAVTG